jgi:linoleate 10R-lipoxygenase
MSSIFSTLSRQASNLHDSDAPVDLGGAAPAPGFLQQKIQDIDQIVRRGPAFKVTDLPTYIDAVKNIDTGTDDRKFLLEKLLVLMSRLPDSSAFAKRLQHFVIDALYNDLPHPPSGYLTLPSTGFVAAAQASPRLKYASRSADGSQYNPLFPTLGQARSPYARSVPSVNPTPVSALPDPGLVFDTLLRRPAGGFVPHPGGISSLFFAFADLVIHSIFNTNALDWTINDASSYLDLSPLYGSSQKDVDQIRKKDGTGKLWDDVFADKRLLFMPPATCALLVLLNRNHNVSFF